MEKCTNNRLLWQCLRRRTQWQTVLRKLRAVQHRATDALLAAVKPLLVFSQMPQIIHWWQFDNEKEATRQSRCLSRSRYNWHNRLQTCQPMTDQNDATCFINGEDNWIKAHRCTTLNTWHTFYLSGHPLNSPTLWHRSRCELGVVKLSL